MRFDQIIEWMWDSYWYDLNWLKANTKKDDIAKKNLEKIEMLKNLFTQQIPNVETTQNIQPNTNQVQANTSLWAWAGNTNLWTQNQTATLWQPSTEFGAWITETPSK